MLGLGPAETASTRETVASEGVSPKVMSMEVLATVPMTLRSPRPKPMLMREVPKPKKDNQKKLMPVCESPRKHAPTQARRKEKLSAKEKGKVVNLEVEEGLEDIDLKGVDPILKLPEYIPLRKGKAKVQKDPDAGQFSINTPLLPKNITFEGPPLVRVPHLKLEDWNFIDHDQFPHLATETFMRRLFYK